MDAIQALSWIGHARTLFDVLGEPRPVRGYSFEAFSLGPSGVREMVRRGSAKFMLEADLTAEKATYRYRIEPEFEFRSGRLRVADEYLAQLGAAGQPKGAAAIERVGSNLHIRRKGNRLTLGRSGRFGSLRAFGSKPERRRVSWLEHVRAELLNWRAYYFERAWRCGRKSRRLTYPTSAFMVSTSRRFSTSSARTSRSISSCLARVALDRAEHRIAERRAGRAAWNAESDDPPGWDRVLLARPVGGHAPCSRAEHHRREPVGGALLAVEEPENGVHPRGSSSSLSFCFSPCRTAPPPGCRHDHSPLFADAILR